MLGYEPPQPRYWKALIVVAPFVAVIAWSLPLMHIRLPESVVLGVAVFVTFAVASVVHYRVLNDWRTRWQMDIYDRDQPKKE